MIGLLTEFVRACITFAPIIWKLVQMLEDKDRAELRELGKSFAKDIKEAKTEEEQLEILKRANRALRGA